MRPYLTKHQECDEVKRMRALSLKVHESTMTTFPAVVTFGILASAGRKLNVVHNPSFASSVTNESLQIFNIMQFNGWFGLHMENT
jgi:hypothetical protein